MGQDNNAWQDDPYAAAYPETAEFWAAAARGELLLKTCSACQRTHWYPRAVCPMCGSADLQWQRASGKGTVYAFSPARRADPVYALAYVTLEEGPTLLTNIIGADPDSLRIGQNVQVVFQPATEGRMMPYFEPA